MARRSGDERFADKRFVDKRFVDKRFVDKRCADQRDRDYAEGLRFHLDQATRARLRGAGSAVAAQLSGGLDSSSVAATAARLLAPDGGKVVAFTAVPREGYDGPCPNRGVQDEGPLAAATAAMYPNMEHVLIRAGHLSPLAELDDAFFLFERPLLNLCNRVWVSAIDRAARARGLNVLLTGQSGNMSLSYGGLDLLPDLLGRGRLIRLWREAAALVRNRQLSWRSAAALAFGPYIPGALWQWLVRTFRGNRHDIREYTAIRSDRMAALGLGAVARERSLDFSYRPRRDGFSGRLWVLGRVDRGYNNKGTLAGWGLDQRDPTGDKRLVEYCLSVPEGEYLAGGVPRSLARRALADRLPRAVLRERRRGYQAADWHEGLSSARDGAAAELQRMEFCPPVAATLDIRRMKNLLENWPSSGWERANVRQPYRLALLRGISAGHFLRTATEAKR